MLLDLAAHGAVGGSCGAVFGRFLVTSEERLQRRESRGGEGDQCCTHLQRWCNTALLQRGEEGGAHDGAQQHAGDAEPTGGGRIVIRGAIMRKLGLPGPMPLSLS